MEKGSAKIKQAKIHCNFDSMAKTKQAKLIQKNKKNYFEFWGVDLKPTKTNSALRWYEIRNSCFSVKTAINDYKKI